MASPETLRAATSDPALRITISVVVEATGEEIFCFSDGIQEIVSSMVRSGKFFDRFVHEDRRLMLCQVPHC